MIVDARNFAGRIVESDVCIAGGGLAGIALAHECIDAPFTVCVLESGGWEAGSETRSLDEGENTGFPYEALDTARARVLGGSSTLWHIPLGGTRIGARIRPLDPIDFEERDWVPYSGWPFSGRCLDTYYDRAQQMCRTVPTSFDPRDWADPVARSPLPFGSGELQTIMYKFCRRELFTDVYPQAVARAENITTCLYATVLEIDTNEAADHVTELRVATSSGEQFSVRARAFVLAAGGIETPRLLLLSNRRQPEGLGNRHDRVGRFFMEHIHFWSGMVVPSTPEPFERTALYNEIQTVDDVAVVGKLALSECTLRRERLLNSNIQLMPCSRVDPFRYPPPRQSTLDAFRALARRTSRSVMNDLQTVAVGWTDVARSVARRIRTRVADLPTTRVFVFANMAEQRPNPESRVTLGQGRDRFGLPRVRLSWQMTPQDIRSIERTQGIIGAALERCGCGRFYRELLDDVPPSSTHGGYHHMGTTRMHADPKEGVVDVDCRVHGVDNLYVAGPSVFPTGGYANPVLTVLALSIRLADHLKSLAATSEL